MENFVFYNVTNYGAHEDLQGLYRDAGTDGCPNFHNVAFVNIHIDRVEESAARSQWINTATDHLLLWHITHHKLTFWMGAPNVTNLSVRACSWEKMTMSPANAAAYSAGFENNHYVVGSGFQVFAGGSQSTTGDPMYVSAGSFDFHPAKDSPLRDRVDPLVAYSDAEGNVRTVPSSVGAFDPSGGGGSCMGDLARDGVINVDDLLMIVNRWGDCSGCPEDFTPPQGDGQVDVSEILFIIMNWGGCD
jgi:hypothetical protein